MTDRDFNMNQEDSHRMVGDLLDTINDAKYAGKEVSLIVMLGEGWQGLMTDISAKQFLKQPGPGKPWTFAGIPVASSGDQPGRLFRVE